MKPSKIIISGGGTGGHIYPALAIAQALQAREEDADILFVGALGRMEMEKIPQNGYPIKGLWIDGLQRSLSLRNLLFPIKLLVSLVQALVIIVRFKPQLVVGTGGFASGPLLFVASWLGIPALIQEQNSYPGITNKILGKRVKKIAVAYEGMERFFPSNKLVITGNPIRKNLTQHGIDPKKAKTFFGRNPNSNTLVVLGGSLGARKINQIVADHNSYFASHQIELIWQCGSLYYDTYKSYQNTNCTVVPFVAEMDQLYAAADLIISRSGAGTLSELCIAGKPCLLIPSPNVAENHQMHNAQALAQKGAAQVLAEKDLEKEFIHAFESLWKDDVLREKMGQEIQKLGRPDAAKTIVDELEKLRAA
ncbi:MAG: undecaprenyldiphospho-muramoylpentapeptide beta-N-acetylglucosaminyltransferase [Flavobacteriaceae bacterium]